MKFPKTLEGKNIVRQSIEDRLSQQKEFVNKRKEERPISFSLNALLGFGS